MKPWRLLIAIAAAALLTNAIEASAQSYPTRPIILVVPFPPGGATDPIGRIVAERMGRFLGQSVLVENTTGAGGSIGVARVVRAAPDGYVLGIGHVGSHVINGAIYPQYDLLKDLEPVALIASNTTFLVSRTGVPAANLKELIAWARVNKDKVSIGSSGPGSPAHVSGVYFKQLTDSQAQIIQYRGAGPAMQDLIAGHIDLYFDQAMSAVPNIRAGRVKAYAVTGPTRTATAPEVPTVDEAGLPGLYMAVWHGLWAPKGTPKSIIARLNSAVVETLADPAVRQRLGDLGQDIPARDQQSPEALGAYQKAEIEKWWPLIKAAGIKAE
jgi:tripartite-type tricarboxylate transporter receptor subunit TctC